MPARLASFVVVRDPAAQERRTQVAVRLFLRGLRPRPTAGAGPVTYDEAGAGSNLTIREG
jgi:hypothetical protein